MYVLSGLLLPYVYFVRVIANPVCVPILYLVGTVRNLGTIARVLYLVILVGTVRNLGTIAGVLYLVDQ